MNNDSAKAIQAIPNLIQFAKKLIALTDDMSKQASFNDTDHLALMSLCFVSKQIEHLRSILILIESGQYRDAGLIARSMIEGLCILLWAAKKPQERPFQWKSYAWVEDYRLMLKKERAGEKVDSSKKSMIIEQLHKYGTPFLKNNTKINHLQLSRDPYRKKWIDKNVYEICKDVEGDLLYERIYRETSQWIHWTIKGMSWAICRNDLAFEYTNRSEDIGATALASGFQSLFESSKLLNDHLKLGFDDKLGNIRKEYADFHMNGSK